MNLDGESLSAVDAQAKRLLDDLNQIKMPKLEDKIKKPFKRQIVWKSVAVFIVGHAVAFYTLYLCFT